VVDATGAEVVAGLPDADAITAQTGVPVTRTVRQGDTVAVGDCSLEVIAIAGHTPGSIALLYADPAGHPHLFTGDSLFPGGVGNTFGDEAAFAQLIDEVETKVFQRLPDETWFYPGHGGDSTIGAERPHLAEWRQRGW
jgi:glyoxylase-like metal-dependent hydrolase (beta-lactamase superfamily II)